jgi:hypothetical protein
MPARIRIKAAIILVDILPLVPVAFHRHPISSYTTYHTLSACLADGLYFDLLVSMASGQGGDFG